MKGEREEGAMETARQTPPHPPPYRYIVMSQSQQKMWSDITQLSQFMMAPN